MATLVNRATSERLSGPDWAMNMELCEIIRKDPGMTKDAVKACKKQIAHKNPRVKLLALTLLETVMKNCGDVVHHQVATKDVLHEMVKIAKKNKDVQVRDKILSLLDIWQEAFGGPNGIYPQFFLAYDELRRTGAIFPHRTENPTPLFTTPQTYTISSNLSSSLDAPSMMPSGSQAPRQNDLSLLSLSDIHNARSGMDVLAEMLNAINPHDKQALRDEVILELVEQCCTAEKQVMQLIGTTSDEELLCQGLSLNDDLKRVLAKHKALVSGISLPLETPSAPPLLNHESEEEPEDSLSQLVRRSTSKMRPSSSASLSGGSQLVSLPAPVESHSQLQNMTTSSTAGGVSTIDLLSGDVYGDSNQPQIVPITTQGVQSAVAGSAFVENEQVHSQLNGIVPGSFEQPLGRCSYDQMHEQVNNSYLVPWAQTQLDSDSSAQTASGLTLLQSSGPSFAPQQAALIYGTNHLHAQGNDCPSSNPQQLLISENFSVQKVGLQSISQTASITQPLTPQGCVPSQQAHQLQENTIFNANMPNMTQMVSQQGHGPPPPVQHEVYMSYHAQPEQELGFGSHAYSISVQSKQSQSVSSHLPRAPWVTENTSLPDSSITPSPFDVTVAPSFPVQTTVAQEMLHQHQFTSSGQFSPFVQPGMMQMQNLSTQSTGSCQSMEPKGLYMQQYFDYGLFQHHNIHQKQVKKEDGLFKDLFDLAKTEKVGASSK
ncbi:hypothetical protein KP509_34G026000 [Ceratopteris richardii]|uniref:Uncharacterized protein n=1 Tax=Ceratopteris richardii TaxID=49495 RepID=A0A8T2QJX8_CERRI|nr:hypothetical protein KP509_34G026000 [Ceratopteris richardii]